MKFDREARAWLIICITAAAAGVLFAIFGQPEIAGFSAARPGLFDTAPSFFATIAFTAFFLLIRFFIRGKKPPGRTELKHLGFALLLSLVLLASWELTRLLLTEQVRYFPARLLGGFVACLVVILLWMFIRARLREKKDDSSSSGGA